MFKKYIASTGPIWHTPLVILLIVNLGVSSLWGQTTKRAIQPGNWNDPNTWSPVGVPSANAPTDTLIIDTYVTYTGILDARNLATRLFKVTASGDLKASSPNDSLILGGVDMLVNEGWIDGNPVIGLGDIHLGTYNMGVILCSALASSDKFVNMGELHADMFVQSDSFINRPGALVIGRSSYTSTGYFNSAQSTFSYDSLNSVGTLANEGDMILSYWLNADTALGSAGRFCISGCWINVGSILGTLDLCDASPGGSCDLNVGYIAPTVTTCMRGACSTPIAITPAKPTEGLAVYPNPSQGFCKLRYDGPLGLLSIYNSHGQRVYSQTIEAESIALDLHELPKGLYHAIVDAAGRRLLVKIVLE